MTDIPDPVRHIAIPPGDERHRTEWLVANALGGYASGTILGFPTRRYHGLLIASMPNPAARVMMLNSVAVQLRIPAGATWARVDVGWVPPAFSAGIGLEIADFRLELGLPVWVFRGFGIVLERRVVMSYGQNTTAIVYRMLEGKAARIELRPAVQFRGHDEPVSATVEAYPLRAAGRRIELLANAPIPDLRLHLDGERTSFVIEPLSVPDIQYKTEAMRGYASRGHLYSPGRFRADLRERSTVVLFASTEPWDTLLTMSADEMIAAEIDRRRRLLDAAVPAARVGAAAELVLAADAFVVRPVGRHEDHVRAGAAGDEAWTVIAGYHWFTDWGRDTMISLEGLTLLTGRVAQAASILRMFAHHIRDGLVPNMFPEGSNHGVYHTADATLWFFHAIDRYLRASGDRRTLLKLLPTLRDCIEHHMNGTRFDIHVDHSDGLLAQGAEGYHLTWMDAKVGDWVVTPRRGKAVEINALWFNALCLMSDWLARTGDADGAAQMAAAASRAKQSFNGRFWNERTGYLFDVVDGEHGDDDACRPNQLFAISLPNPVLEPSRWKPVLDAVERELVTPVGLRSLSPKHPDFKRTYHGDRTTRDAAYHQGTVWTWLIGPYVDAVLRTRPGDPSVAAHLEGLVESLGAHCIGMIPEVFDAEEPYLPGGCVAQAWGIAELLRALVLATHAK